MMKKFISLILTVVIIMSCFVVNVSAIDYDWLENDRSFTNYKDLLYDIYYNPEKYVEGGPSVENDYFAIVDINDDGIDELIVRYIQHAMYAQYMAVWTYDRSVGRVKLLNTFGADTEFYSTGYAKQEWSHNQEMSYPIWPYTIASIDSSDDMTIDVEAYKSGKSLYREEYEALEDADNDGIVYVIEYNNDSILIPLTYSEYRAFEDKYIPENKLIPLDYEYNVFTEYSIANLDANYGSDLPVNGTMTGDLNGDNKVTAADARAVLRFAAKIDTPTETQIKLADVDSSGKVTAADARKILRVAAKLDSGFGTVTIPDFIHNKESYNGVYVDHAKNVLPYFDSNIHYIADNEYSEDIVFYTDGTITDFCFLDLSVDTDTYPYGGNNVVTVNRSFGDLCNDCPVVIRMTFWDLFPAHGISFRDADGVLHTYGLHQSGNDGSIYLVEFY